MGIDQFFENINDFDIEELDNIREKISKKILEELAELPYFDDGCCMNDGSEATQKEFDGCEEKDIAVLVCEDVSGFDEPLYRERCVKCGGVRKYEQ